MCHVFEIKPKFTKTMKVRIAQPKNKIPGDKIIGKIRNPEPIDTKLSRDLFKDASSLYETFTKHPAFRLVTVSSGTDNVPIQIGALYGNNSIFANTVLEDILEREFSRIIPDIHMNTVLEAARNGGLKEAANLGAIDPNSRWQWQYHVKLFPSLVRIGSQVTELELLKISEFKLPSLAIIIPVDLLNEYVDIGSKLNTKTIQAKTNVPVSQGTLLAFNQCCGTFYGIYSQMRNRHDIAFNNRINSSRLIVINAVKVHSLNPDYKTILMNFGSTVMKSDPVVRFKAPTKALQVDADTTVTELPALIEEPTEW